MLTFEEARNRLLARIEALPKEAVHLAESDGRVLREDLIAPFDVPSFSSSAMDGYALASAALSLAGPWTLEVVGESRAGSPAVPLTLATAQRISTGAELPSGADSVIPQELVTRDGGAIRFTETIKIGQHVRRRGEDLQQGALGLGSGTRLNPSRVALAASLDYATLLVGPKPRVRVLCTGDELRAPGTPPAPGKVPDSISIALGLLAARAGATVLPALFSADDQAATERAVAAGLEDVDLLLTVGGVSVGDHDWVRPALEAQGVELDFWKVAIKPGKPLAFGRMRATGPWVLGLPGNPASALITFALFGVPLLRALQGDAAPLPTLTPLPLARAVRHKAGRLEFLRAMLSSDGSGASVLPLPNQASGALISMAQGDALALIPAEVENLASGSVVEVLRWQDL
jgi:molybdopterin molybdotransferase